MLFLDSLYRESAARAGITYVDVWDGFVDEAGRLLQKGPDFEGQIRQLRSYDGVYFTRPGARKLAHYVAREINRLLVAHSAPLAVPSEPATPEANAIPGQPSSRPLAGPIVPLVASSIVSDQLLGGPASHPPGIDALAERTLIRGEALTPPAGRADDSSWPRRGIAEERAKADRTVASTQPASPATSSAGADGGVNVPNAYQKPKRPHPHQPLQSRAPLYRNFFGFPTAAPLQIAPQPRAPAARGVPRPPANVGHAVSVQ
jgi:uncharacterized protein